MPLLSRFNGLRRQRSGPQDRPGPTRKALFSIQTLHLPLRFTGPVAMLEPGFRGSRNMREFEAADLAGIQAFAPHAAIASLHAALALADQKLRGLIALPSLQFALVVLTRTDDEPLGDHHRDLLWRAFAVPVFEQLRDHVGTVIAWECEVHDGLHLVEHAVLPDLPCEVVKGHCECGAETPRLRNLATLRHPLRQRAAAAAA